MSQPVLVNVSDNVNVKIESIRRDKFTIGRGLHNHCVLNDTCVSRTHCAVEQEGDRWVLVDLSSNGTTLNGELIDKRHNLTTGDIICLSSTTKFIFKLLNVQLTSDSLDDDEFFDIIGQTIMDVQALESNRNEPDSSNLNSSSELESPVKSHDPPQVPAEVKNEEPLRNSNEVPKNRGASLNIVEDELQCAICAEMFVQAMTLSCSHTFCKFCITQWRKDSSICPICRGTITSICPTRVIDAFIEKVIESASEDVKQHRRELLEQRQTQVSASSSRTSATDEIMDEEDDDYDDDVGFIDYDPMATYDINFVPFAPFVPFVASRHAALESSDGLPGALYGGFGFCCACGDAGCRANGSPALG